jgi:hypothetical protein
MHCSSDPPLLVEPDRVHGLLVAVEEAEVLLRGIAALLVLVEHGEDEGLQRAGPLGRAAADVVDESLVVFPRVVDAGPEAAGRGPAALGHDDPDVGRAGLLERGDDGVHHGVEQVVVVEAVAVVPDGGARLERGVAQADVARVVPVREVRVHVGEQRRAGAGQVARDVRHVALREGAAGGRERVGDHVEAHRRGALDAREAGARQGGVQVAHRREEAARVVALHLVAHRDVLDADGGVVGPHVALHPRVRERGAPGELAQDAAAVAGVEDERDAGVAQGGEGFGVGGVDAHAFDALGPVELHHVAAGRQVVAQRAVADADGVHGCTQ